MPSRLRVTLDPACLDHPGGNDFMAWLANRHELTILDVAPDIIIGMEALRCAPRVNVNAYAIVRAVLNNRAGEPFADVPSAYTPNGMRKAGVW